MYDRPVLGLKEAQEAIQAMIKEVESKKDRYWQHATFAVVDFSGNLIALARMDGGHQQGPFMAIRKAYTAATWAMTTGDFQERLVKTHLDDVSNFGTEVTACKGGVPILPPDVSKGTPERPISPIPYVVGAIGIATVGRPEIDEEIAMVGVKYLESVLWPSK